MGNPPPSPAMIHHEDAHSAGRAPAIANGRGLRAMYLLTSSLALFMVAWILVLPSSWLMGWWEWHDDVVNRRFLGDSSRFVSPLTVTKYAGHTAVKLTHILPGALWAGSIPLQLNSEFRRKHPVLHRRLGYAFALSVMSMAVGIALILHRGLGYENDYPDLPPPSAVEQSAKHVFFAGNVMFFVYTLLRAVSHAREGNVALHQRFIVRHIGSGIWVAVQRVLIGMRGRATTRQLSQLEQRDNFGMMAAIGVAVAAACSEFTVRVLIPQPRVNKNKND